MKATDIFVHEEYAVRFPLRGTTRTMKFAVRQCVVVELLDSGQVTVAHHVMRPIAGDLREQSNWEVGRRLVDVHAIDFLARWCDWGGEVAPAGGVVGPEPRSVVVDGVTYTEHDLWASG